MRTLQYSLLLLVSAYFFSAASCPKTSEPDLAWSAYQNIQNTCTNTVEYLDTRNLYFANNLGYPFNGYPQSVLLYWRPDSTGFYDCLGYQWFILPGSRLQSYRYLMNMPSGITEPARTPNAQVHVTVTSPNGQVDSINGPIVVFGSLPAGNVITVPGEIYIALDSTVYYLEYRADPQLSVLERDEQNNAIASDFGVNRAGQKSSFQICTPDERTLANMKKPYVLYQNGNIVRYER